MIYVFLAEGFEEVEALAPVDLLRRAGIEVETVAVPEGRTEGRSADIKTVYGARGVSVNADITLDEVDLNKAKLLFLPGGMPGTNNLAASAKLMEMVDSFAKSGDTGKRVAAICAAPARILGARGLLKGKKATCYPGMEGEMTGADFVTDKVVTDGNITTSRGMGTAVELGLELVSLFAGKAKADELRKAVVA